MSTVRIAYRMPYQPTPVDKLDDEIFDSVEKAIDLGISPESYFTSVQCAWQEAIRKLSENLNQASRRIYLRYQVPEKKDANL